MFRYFGSKSSTASFVAGIALKGIRVRTAADAFGGLGNIGVEFRARGVEVSTCDLLGFPNAFQSSRIECSRTPSFNAVKSALGVSTSLELETLLSEATTQSGWFVREYSETRQFFTPSNARRIAGAWGTISRWHRMGWLSERERKYAVASLLNSADKCANTAGTYYAYLKHWHRKALKPFQFQWLPIEVVGNSGRAFHGDALTCLRGKQFDLLYLDPPYNNRDYSRYYHLPETLAGLKAVRIDPGSKCGQPLRKSVQGPFIRKAMGLPYLEELAASVRWRRLVVQYADGAHIALARLRPALKAFGSLTEHKTPALGYRTTSGARAHTHHVFIVDR